jgi:hypothetical protein
MSKKIGILTFHYGYNYGGILQSYALCEVIKEMGYDVKIINYIPNRYWFLLGLIRNFSWKKCYIMLRHIHESRQAFVKFRGKHLRCTNLVNAKKLHRVANSFDIIITGSDQVWNPSQHDKAIYFLNWTPEFRGKRVSYAPCCGINTYLNSNEKILCDALSKFHYLSVRNEETSLFVHSLIGKKPAIVPDPTLLYDFDKFVKKENPKPYILTYILGDDIMGGNEEAISYIKNIFKGITVIAIVIAVSNPVDCCWADQIRYNISPDEWINLIANATFFYTDSFHGTIFALKYQIPFVAYYSSPIRAPRFIDLKNIFQIDNHIISSVSELMNKNIMQKPVDVENIMQKQINIGLKYIENTLNNLI